MNEKKLVTMKMWEEAGSFFSIVNPGNAVEESIVDEFLNCVPPVSNRYGYVQCGEPYCAAWDKIQTKWRPTFVTFSKGEESWFYCGNCYVGETVDRTEMMYRNLNDN